MRTRDAGRALFCAYCSAVPLNAYVNVTNPASPAGVGRLQDSGSLELDGPCSVDTFQIGSMTYAAVAACRDDGLQIVNVTNPASPAAAGRLQNGGNVNLGTACAVDTFQIGFNTYAAVMSCNNHRLQLVNVTNPASPADAGRLWQDLGVRDDLASAVDTFQIGSKAYAAAAVGLGHAVQIFDVTIPTLGYVGSLANSNSVLLREPYGLKVFRAGGSTYAAVTAYDIDSIQLVDVTNPASPAGAGNLRGNSLELDGAKDVAVFVIGTSAYAIVAAERDDGVQIARLTEADTERPVLVSAALHANTGELTMMFNEAMDISATNLARLHVSDAGEKNTVSLADASFDRAAADSSTISMTLTRNQLDDALAMATPQLDISAGAASDIHGNTIDDAPDNPIKLLGDLIMPVFASAVLDENTGVLTIEFDETIDISEVDLAKMYVSETGKSNEVSLAGAAFDSGAPDSASISATLVREQLDMIIPMSAPQLDIEAGAVQDLFGNAIDAAPDNPITTIPDTAKPAFAYAALDAGTGGMTMTFNETIDVSDADLAKMYVSDAGDEDTVSMAGASFNRTAPDSDEVSITLVQAQLDSIIQMDAPQLDIAAGAVSDISGNAIDAAPDGYILIFIQGADTVLWNATITSALNDDDGQKGWSQSGLGSIVHHTPAGNTFVLGGRTHAVTGLSDYFSSSGYHLDISPRIPLQDRDFVHIVMGDLRCSFAAAGTFNGDPFWTYSDAEKFFTFIAGQSQNISAIAA